MYSFLTLNIELVLPSNRSENYYQQMLLSRSGIAIHCPTLCRVLVGREQIRSLFPSTTSQNHAARTYRGWRWGDYKLVLVFLSHLFSLSPNWSNINYFSENLIFCHIYDTYKYICVYGIYFNHVCVYTCVSVCAYIYMYTHIYIYFYYSRSRIIYNLQAWILKFSGFFFFFVLSLPFEVSFIGPRILFVMLYF